ncbi:conserved hypothetical protein [Histoplasma capsulatum G186AR]|uniref:GATA-type domain-containing protein n=2 Tax=Ajellomyces capsulatus TaxID=5037 RepID=C0NPX4_AJECG|nr:uncharacterized protein HCBG_05204 [Histoplasma capsulatum G186AR]EEH06984.1 conserved hypothetical protein [Histoplasma capsulatum G186AR]KAG5293985.1 GATA-type sexual development transcription factor NsdD [Histoplasma capsulatum]QSS75437.1 GATA-type sexual development transcription factor NsdD [Histoplasma capsulatum G186AR]
MVTVDTGRYLPVYGVSGSTTAPFQSPRGEEDGIKELRGGLHHGDAHRDSLPSIGQLDLETASKDRQHNSAQFPSATAGLSVSSLTMANHPGHAPFGYMTSATPRSTLGGSAEASPGDIRYPGDENKEQKTSSEPQHTVQRQSLPSIHEALGSHTLPYPPHPSSSSSNPGHPPVSISIPPTAVARVGADVPSGPPNPFSISSLFSRDNPFNAHSSVPGIPPRPEGQRASFASTHSQESHNRSVPSLSSGKSPTQSCKTGTPSLTNSQSSTYEFSASPSAALMSSHPSYAPYPQQAPYSGPGPNTPPSMQYPPGPYETRPGLVHPWNQNGIDKARMDQQGGIRASNGTAAPHSETVKRQLDVYDVESSYHEIIEAGSRVVEFARHFGAKAHQSNRSGPVVGLIPQLSEIDDIAQTIRRTSDALARIRGLAVEQALADQQVEQRAQRQAYKANGARNEEQATPYREDYKSGGGFAGGDTKKRRGKAAPPGRCHSCNRAETPEWRRGPDGARTLCNACGLHYAKLTRKAGNNKHSSLGPNIRPKNSAESRSPTRS